MREGGGERERERERERGWKRKRGPCNECYCERIRYIADIEMQNGGFHYPPKFD